MNDDDEWWWWMMMMNDDDDDGSSDLSKAVSCNSWYTSLALLRFLWMTTSLHRTSVDFLFFTFSLHRSYFAFVVLQWLWFLNVECDCDSECDTVAVACVLKFIASGVCRNVWFNTTPNEYTSIADVASFHWSYFSDNSGAAITFNKHVAFSINVFVTLHSFSASLCSFH